MYVYTHTCMCVCAHKCLHTYKSVYVHAHTCNAYVLHTHANHIYCIDAIMRTSACMSAYVCNIHMCTNAFYTCIHTSMYACIHVCICMHVCIHVYMHLSNLRRLATLMHTHTIPSNACIHTAPHRMHAYTYTSHASYDMSHWNRKKTQSHDNFMHTDQNRMCHVVYLHGLGLVWHLKRHSRRQDSAHSCESEGICSKFGPCINSKRENDAWAAFEAVALELLQQELESPHPGSRVLVKFPKPIKKRRSHLLQVVLCLLLS